MILLGHYLESENTVTDTSGQEEKSPAAFDEVEEGKIIELILGDNLILENYNDFLQILYGGQENPLELINSVINEGLWHGNELLISVLFENTENEYQVNQAKLAQLIQAAVHAADSPIVGLPFESNASKTTSLYTSSANSETSEEIGIDINLRSSASNYKTKASFKSYEGNIKGKIKTYASKMMGGFDYDIRGESTKQKVYIKEDSMINRPIKVVGNLPNRSAGAHVVSFSVLTKHILSLVENQTVYEAIENLIVMIARLHDVSNSKDLYQAIIDKAKKYLERRNEINDLSRQMEAFQFLKSEFIPYIVAVWNQKPGRAFSAARSSQELGKEAAIAKSFKLTQEDNIDVTISEFVRKIVDYRPINFDEMEAVATDSHQDMLLKGIRTNKFSDLTYVIKDIIELFLDIYRPDPSDHFDYIVKLIKEILVQNNWDSYYIVYPEDIEAEVEEIDINTLVRLMLPSLKEYNPFLFETYDSETSSYLDSLDDSMSISSRGRLSLDSHNAISLCEVDDEYYSEDQITHLLRHYLKDDELYYIAPQTQFENRFLLEDNLRNAMARAMSGRIAVIPIHLHENHWVGAVIREQNDGNIEVIYVDPMGHRIEAEANANLFVTIISSLERNVHIVDLGTQNFIQQRNNYDCGPFTIDNLVRLARAGNQLDNLNANQILELGILESTLHGNAAHLRQEYNTILTPQPEVVGMANASVDSLIDQMAIANNDTNQSLFLGLDGFSFDEIS